MKKALSFSLLLALYVTAPGASAQQAKPAAVSSAAPSAIQKNIEAYLRHLYAFGADVRVVVGPLKETAVEGLLETNVDVTLADSKEAATFYVSKDGKFLFRGDLSDLTKDPLAENRARMQLQDAPALGDPKAPVTLVEYSDFECPVCRSLHDVLRGMLPNYAGKVRVVFKDFPIEQIHPWARTAALAGRCAYQQDPKAFWKLYDLIYDNQELISPENAWTKITDYAAQSGLDTNAFKGCLASPEAAAAVDASKANGRKLEVGSTPTLFINGRRMAGADAHLIEQYITYELAEHNSQKPAEK